MTAHQFIRDTEALFAPEMLAKVDLVLRARFGSMIDAYDALLTTRINEALAHVHARIDQLGRDTVDAAETLDGDVWDLRTALTAMETRVADLHPYPHESRI